MEKELTKLQSTVKYQKLKIKKLETQITKCGDQSNTSDILENDHLWIVKLSDENENLRTNLSQSTLLINEKEEEITCIQSEVAEISCNYENIKSDLAISRNELDSLRENYKALHDQYNAILSTVNNVDHINTISSIDLVSKDDEIAQLKKDLSKLHDQLKSMTAIEKESEMKNNLLVSSISALVSEFSAKEEIMKNKVSSMESELQKAHEDVVCLKLKLNESTIQSQVVNNIHDNLNVIPEALQEELRISKEQLENLRETMRLSFDEQLKLQTAELLEKDQVIDKLNEKLFHASVKVTEQENIVQQLSRQLNDVTDKYTNMTETLPKVEKDKKGISDELECAKETFSKELSQLWSELAAQKMSTEFVIQGYMKEIESLREELKDSHQQAQIFATELQMQEQTLNNLTTNHNQALLEAQNNTENLVTKYIFEIESLSKQFNDLSQQKLLTNKVSYGCTEEVETLQKEVLDKQKQLQQFIIIAEEKEQTIHSLKEQHKEEIGNLSKELSSRSVTALADKETIFQLSEELSNTKDDLHDKEKVGINLSMQLKLLSETLAQKEEIMSQLSEELCISNETLSQTEKKANQLELVFKETVNDLNQMKETMATESSQLRAIVGSKHAELANQEQYIKKLNQEHYEEVERFQKEIQKGKEEIESILVAKKEQEQQYTKIEIERRTQQQLFIDSLTMELSDRSDKVIELQNQISSQDMQYKMDMITNISIVKSQLAVAQEELRMSNTQTNANDRTIADLQQSLREAASHFATSSKSFLAIKTESERAAKEMEKLVAALVAKDLEVSSRERSVTGMSKSLSPITASKSADATTPGGAMDLTIGSVSCDTMFEKPPYAAETSQDPITSLRLRNACLLSEKEDLERIIVLTQQQVDSLKTDIRDLEGMLSRERELNAESHAYNAEYLSNVLRKFLLSTDNAERYHLIPVICAILHYHQEDIKDISSRWEPQINSKNKGLIGWWTGGVVQQPIHQSGQAHSQLPLPQMQQRVHQHVSHMQSSSTHILPQQSPVLKPQALGSNNQPDNLLVAEACRTLDLNENNAIGCPDLN